MNTLIQTKHWLIEGINEWELLIKLDDWFSFTFIDIYCEKDMMTYGYEFIFVFLGFGFRIVYNSDEALERIDVWKEEGLKELKKEDETT